MPERRLLFLQGPASPFLRVVADQAEAAGARIHKLNTCLGDAVFWWPRRADRFAGRPIEWPGFIDRYMRDRAITDIVMLGDGRPLHAAAIQVATASGVRIHILEHGYLRPDWLTLEPDGMSGHSRFPDTATELAELAAGLPAPMLGARYQSRFLTYALYDLAFHLPNVLLGWVFHPHYRTHGPVHPAREYAGWIRKGLTAGWRRRTAHSRLRPYLETPGTPYFLFPLQLPGDYQIRVHAPGGDLFRLVAATLHSFSHSAPPDCHLLFKVHPLDNGLSGWQEQIAIMAARLGMAGRVAVVDGGNLDAMIKGARGVVTVNSSVGITALMADAPVIALGAAIYDIEGLSHRGSLAVFWREPERPQPDVLANFVRTLAGTTQLRGGFIGRAAIQDGARAVAARLLQDGEALPRTRHRPDPLTDFRYRAELFAPSDAPEQPPSRPAGTE